MTLHLITGPPAAGKTTWVQQHAQPGDITIDYDAIANSLTPPGLDPYDLPAHIKAVTKAARQAAIDTALTLAATVNVYLIHSMPSERLLDTYRRRGATIHVIDPGQDVVLARCKAQRPWRMHQAAKQWYATPDPKKETDDQPIGNLGQPSESW